MLNSIKHKTYHLLLQLPAVLWAVKSIKFRLTLKRILRKQLSIYAPAEYPTPAAKTKRILLPQIETSHYQLYQMFILAKALQLRGAEVALLVCGSRLDGCEGRNVKNTHQKDSCFHCRFNLKHAIPLYGMKILKLCDIISDEQKRQIDNSAATIASRYPDLYFYKGINVIPMTNDSVTRYYYGAMPDDAGSVKSIREQHLATAMIGIEAAEFIDRTFKPNVILNNMYVYSVTEPYLRYFRRCKDVDVVSITISPADYHSVMVNMMDLYVSTERYLAFKNSRKGQKLTQADAASLESILNQRSRGDIQMFADMGYFEPRMRVEELLQIRKGKKNIFLFSNIYWDVGMSESGQAYSGVVEWVLDTIDAVKDREDIHLYIKPHPSEKFDKSATSIKGVADFVYEKYPVIPINVTFIHPEMKVSPYDLFPFVDLGLVYNGTLGLEMMLKGIPVVVSGKAPYGMLGFAYEPRTPDEYRRILLHGAGPIEMDKDELALFAYFYLIKTMVPWNLTKQAYADDFRGYTFTSLDDILPGKNKHLDHLCDCILDPDSNVIEGW